MKKQLLLVLIGLALLVTSGYGQPKKYNFLNIYSTQTAEPISKFGSLLTRELHPGIEWGQGKTIRSKKHTAWDWSMRIGYFYHRFVQQGIYINTDIRYSYSLGRIAIQPYAGAGIMGSISNTGVYKLGKNNEYVVSLPFPRVQGSVNLGLGLSWQFQKDFFAGKRIQVCYEQKVQFPYIKSYVPLLPYNSFKVGLEWPIRIKIINKKLQ